MRHIEKHTCIHCGIEFWSRLKDAKYCSRRCAAQTNNQKRAEARRTFQCPHNPGVECNHKTCGSCGWNPNVAQRRLDKFLSEGEEYGLVL